jgi:hypothetical protein
MGTYKSAALVAALIGQIVALAAVKVKRAVEENQILQNEIILRVFLSGGRISKREYYSHSIVAEYLKHLIYRRRISGE